MRRRGPKDETAEIRPRMDGKQARRDACNRQDQEDQEDQGAPVIVYIVCIFFIIVGDRHVQDD